MSIASLPEDLAIRLATIADQDRNATWTMLQALAEWTVCLWLATPPDYSRVMADRAAYSAARGTPVHPCEDCGQITVGCDGCDRCNRCGYPGQ